MSKTRKQYFARLVGRCIILLLCVYLCFAHPDLFSVLDGMNFFAGFSPLIFMGGFYAVSLVVMAILAWIVWEVCIMMYPERFWDKSNVALKCSECTDKLCTQYCQKLRK